MGGWGDGGFGQRGEGADELGLDHPGDDQRGRAALEYLGDLLADLFEGIEPLALDLVGDDLDLQRFNGKELDTATGLSYYGHRYYDPVTLAWNRADPFYRFLPEAAGTDSRLGNLYTFSLNNPVRYIDPDGLSPASSMGFIDPCTQDPDSSACSGMGDIWGPLYGDCGAGGDCDEEGPPDSGKECCDRISGDTSEDDAPDSITAAIKQRLDEVIEGPIEGMIVAAGCGGECDEAAAPPRDNPNVGKPRQSWTVKIVGTTTTVVLGGVIGKAASRGIPRVRINLLANAVDPKILKQIKKTGLPQRGTYAFKPSIVKNKKGRPTIEKAEVRTGPKKGKVGYVDTEGRIWVKDRSHAKGMSDHWDVQIDGGRSYRNVGFDGEISH